MFLKGLLAVFCLVLCMLVSLCIWNDWPDNLLHIVVCDVGQGDAILIYSGFTQLLIDAGPDHKILECLDNYLPFWDTHLEIVVVTHSDSDHIGGMTAVFDLFSVGSMVLSGQAKESDDFRDFSASVRDLHQNGTKLIAPRLNRTIRLTDEIKLYILWPSSAPDPLHLIENTTTETQLSAYFDQKGESELSINDGSIALLLQFLSFSFLTTGDLEEHVEETLVEQGVIKDIDVLKAGHHGSKTSTIAPFLTEARPEFTLVSCGKNNRYGHPHAEVLHRLEKVGSQVFRTDELGHIELQTDGNNYWFFHRSNSDF